MNCEEYIENFFKNDYQFDENKKITLKDIKDLQYYIKNIVPLTFFCKFISDNIILFDDGDWYTLNIEKIN